MALTRTNLINASNAQDSLTSGSFTPSNNSLLVVVCGASQSTGSTLTTMSGGGLTWTRRLQKLENDTLYNPAGSIVEIWTAPVSTGASMTVAHTATVNYGHWLSVYEYTGYDTSSPIGVTATGSRDAATGAFSITLSGAPASSSEVCAGISVNNWETNSGVITTGTGWTQQHLVNDVGGETFGHVQTRTSSTSTSVGWNNVLSISSSVGGTCCAAAIEVKSGSTTHNRSATLTASASLSPSASANRAASATVGASLSTTIVAGRVSPPSRTHLLTSGLGNGNSTYSHTTASFTPSNNSLLVVIASHQTANPAPSTMAISDSQGLTWTLRDSSLLNIALDFPVRIWTAEVATAASMTITIDGTGVHHTWSSLVLTVEEFTGYDTSSPVGLTEAISSAGNGTPKSVSLGGTTAATSVVLGSGHADEGTVTTGSGWTSIANGTYGYNAYRFQTITGAVSDVTFAQLTSGYTTSVAGIEIKGAYTEGASTHNRSATLTAAASLSSTAQKTAAASSALSAAAAVTCSAGLAPISVTHLHSNSHGSDNNPGYTFSVNSITHSANALLVYTVSYVIPNGQTGVNWSVTTSGLTWTKRLSSSQVDATSGDTVVTDVWTTQTGAANTISIGNDPGISSGAIGAKVYSVQEVLNHKQSSPIGLTGTNVGTSGGSNLSVSLGGTSEASSVVIGSFGGGWNNTNSPSITPDTGWTERSDLDRTGNTIAEVTLGTTGQVQSKIGESSSSVWSSVTNITGAWAATAIEIRHSSSTTMQASSSVSADLSLSAAADRLAYRSASLTSAASVACSAQLGGTQYNRSASLSAALSVVASAGANRPASSQLDASASLSSSAERIAQASSQLDASLSVSSSAGGSRPASSQLDAVLNVAASAGAQREASSTLNAALSSTVAAVASRVSSASLSATAAFSAVPHVSRSASSSVAAALSIVVSGGAFALANAAPSGTAAAGSWTTDLGGSDLHTAIDEASPNDADYIQSSVNPVDDVADIAVSMPIPDTPVVRIKYRAKADGSPLFSVFLVEGVTVRATWTRTLTDTYADYEEVLTSEQFSSVTDWSNVKVRFEAG